MDRPKPLQGMKFHRARFCREILQNFSFLSAEFKLRRTSRVLTYEFVDRYADEDVVISVFVAHPELPHISLAVASAPSNDYHFSVAASRPGAELKRRYYRELEKHPEDHGAVSEVYRNVVRLQAKAVRSALAAIRRKRRPGPLWKGK
jgi:hypothetical protein